MLNGFCCKGGDCHRVWYFVWYFRVRPAVLLVVGIHCGSGSRRLVIDKGFFGPVLNFGSLSAIQLEMLVSRPAAVGAVL